MKSSLHPPRESWFHQGLAVEGIAMKAFGIQEHHSRTHGGAFGVNAGGFVSFVPTTRTGNRKPSYELSKLLPEAPPLATAEKQAIPEAQLATNHRPSDGQ